jgi:hypothetical protein
MFLKRTPHRPIKFKIMKRSLEDALNAYQTDKRMIRVKKYVVQLQPRDAIM